ncbi:Tautomerase/MIF [Polychaeton citri CBS 116435]|uniref:Tautomerase/MIF n=1 Tax=Polychaeton citri CBS 116435 TaxID=1314669 RepID=A0A9P4QBJ7_9PEZI|nr:Tautomerase/MIF [Polychaeton citri CBS 116435]
MPCIQIHMVRGVRTPEEIRKLADVVQQVSLDHFNAPPKDRYQIITQHEPYEIICEDTNLGLKRTDKLIFIHVFQQGRSAETKQALYAELAKELKAQCGLDGQDLIVSCVRNEKEDWSFGLGRAQFLTGEL